MFPTATGLDKYEILRELANADTGGTYKAIVRADNKTVAIRLIKPCPTTNPDLSVILQNAKAACALSSPYMVHVLEAYESDGSVCMLMDYTEGSLLSNALGTDKMSDWDLADVARQLCSAVDHANSKNIFHQNLNPSNIIQEWDGTVKLLDYGVTANPVQRAQSNAAAMKALRYVSPEQVSGKPIDRRSNLFSLGVILYEMTTGQSPFNGDQASAVLEQIANRMPPAPRVVKPSIHPGLSDLIMKAISKSPDERFQTGADLLNALDHHRDNQTVAPKPVAPVASPRPLQNHVAAQGPSRYGSPTPPSVAPPARPPVRSTVPPIESRPVPPRPITPAPASSAPRAEAPTPAPPKPAPVPAAPPKPALKPTPRSEFIIVGPKTTVDEPAAPPAVPQGAPVPPPVPAAPRPLVAAAPAAPQAPAAPNVAKTPAAATPTKASPAPVPAPAPKTAAPSFPAAAVPAVARPLPTPVVTPVQTATQVSVPPVQAAPRQQKVAAKSEPQNRLPLIAVGVGLLCLVALAGIGVYFLTHSDTSTQQPVQAQSAAPVEQPAVTEQPVVADQPVASEPANARKKKQKEVQPVAAPLPVLGNLSIQSVPEGAMIEIDGQGGAVTPRSFPNLPTGPRTVRISKPGYEAVTRVVQIEAGQTASISVTLTELRATLVIGSEPDGASITINGEKTGKMTPSTVSLLKGKYTIAFQKQGFLPSESTIEVAGGQSYKVSPRMTPLGNADAVKDVGKLKKFFGGGGETAQMGKVQFRTVPKGAQVSVNGKIMKKPTPMELYFPDGHYEISVSLPGYKAVQKTISVTAGATQSVDVQFEPNK